MSNFEKKSLFGNRFSTPHGEMESDSTNKKRKFDTGPLTTILKTLREPSSPEQKIQALNDFQQISVSYLVELFDETINSLQPCLSDVNRLVRTSALAACIYFFTSACKTPFHVGIFFDGVCPKVHQIFTTYISDLNRAASNPRTPPDVVQNIFKGQTECLAFYATCMDSIHELPSPELASLYTLIDESCNSIQSTFLLLTHPIANDKSLSNNINSILQQAVILTQQLSQLIENIIGKLPALSSDSNPNLKKKTDADTISIIGEQMDSTLNSGWKFIKSVINKYPAQLGGKLNFAQLSDILCNNYETNCDEYMKIAVSNEPEESRNAILDRKLRRMRFFYPTLQLLWKTFPSQLVVQYDSIIGFLVRILSKIPPAFTSSQLSEPVVLALDNYASIFLKNFIRMLFTQSPTDVTKTTLIKKICDESSPNYAIGKILVLFEIYRSIPAADPNQPSSSIVAVQLVKTLPFLMEQMKLAYASFVTSDKNLFNQALISVGVLTLKSFSYQDQSILDEIETFLVENIFNRHFLCYSFSLELWTFILFNADSSLLDRHINLICDLINLSTSPLSTERLYRILKRAIPNLHDSFKETIYNKLVSKYNDGKTVSNQIIAFLSNLPVVHFSDSIKRSILNANLSLSIDLCTKWLQNPNQTNSLYNPILFFTCLFRSDTQLEHVLNPTQKQKIVDFIIQALPKPQLISDPKLAVYILDLGTSCMSSISSTKLFNILSNLASLIPQCPQCKIPLSRFLAQSTIVKTEPSLQREIFSKYLLLWHTVFGDSDWTVFSEACNQYLVFAAKCVFENYESFVPPEAEQYIAGLLENKTFPINPIKSDYDMVLSETKELIAYSRKRKFTPIINPTPIMNPIVPPSNSTPMVPMQPQTAPPKQSTRYPTLEDDPLRKATRMIREGLKMLNPLPIDITRGNIEYLKQELKSLKTIMMNVEEQLYPNIK